MTDSELTTSPSPAGPESDRGGGVSDRGGGAGRRTGWLEEIKGLLVLLLAVLGFHSFIAKPFYIPTGSMIPTLLVGDQLIVSKFPYGWSWVSASFHVLPPFQGRLLGRVPQRGDVIILTPRHSKEDWIKRVIGLPGDTIELREGLIFINGRPIRQQVQPQRDLPVDANNPCTESEFPGALRQEADGSLHCWVNIVRETLPNGVTYDTIDAKRGDTDTMAPVKVPAGEIFVMGDNRDNSADSRVSVEAGGLGGPIPLDNVGGRAEFTTLSFDGSATLNPLTWPGAVRGGRHFDSLRPDHAPAASGTAKR